MKKFGLLVCFLVVGQVAGAQGWTVKPEWVRAHEAFLSSDVMAGRGSATRDEEIAATYVASEFEGYGLKRAPGMESYLQSAAVVSPVLDGKAVLTAGGTTLNEGPDFGIYAFGGGSVSGALVRVAFKDAAAAKVEKGAVVLLTDVPADGNVNRAVRSLRGAAMMLVAGGGMPTPQAMVAKGYKTRLPIRLAEDAGRGGGITIVSVTGETLVRLKDVKDGGVVSLTVHVVPDERPRETFNAVGYLEGTAPGRGTILLTAHLDHLGVGRPVNGDAIYNGANDDAAGTTAVLELAHAMANGPRLKRNVLFVCYGSEEVGGLGSTYFGKHPPVPLTSLVTNLEFEMIGTQDPKMPKGTLLLTGWERSNLGPTLKEHGALLGPDPYPEEHFFERSDNYSLALLGVVAHTAAGWGTPPTYHQPSDDLAHLNVEFMTAAIQSLVEPVRWLAMSDFRPTWNAGGRPEGR